MNNKFYSDLTGSNESLKESRAKMIAELAMQAKAASLQSRINELKSLQFELDKLNDLGPRQTTDLTYREDFNPKDWQEKTDDLEDKIMIQEMKVARAQKNYDKWFKESK